jgi:hypothetical protein
MNSYLLYAFGIWWVVWFIAILYGFAFKRAVDCSRSLEEIKRALSFIQRGEISVQDINSIKTRLATFPERYKQFKTKSNKAMLILYLLVPLIPLEDYFLRNKAGNTLITGLGILTILVSIQIGIHIASLCTTSLLRKLNEVV